ncbi:hypothetical protein KIN20_000276 [Parelaphostrongylus tenuis]|uniref:Uncharacterized protein n=1 Tax=Parelaphostrongylus tenuis TaxID=148309 RepID=A0AAD5QBQ3_PARTN|nr:hypothetical protein KIN20_000276 [Parelaphostrongylus tenuis]
MHSLRCHYSNHYENTFVGDNIEISVYIIDDSRVQSIDCRKDPDNILCLQTAEQRDKLNNGMNDDLGNIF